MSVDSQTERWEKLVIFSNVLGFLAKKRAYVTQVVAIMTCNNLDKALGPGSSLCLHPQ